MGTVFAVEGRFKWTRGTVVAGEGIFKREVFKRIAIVDRIERGPLNKGSIQEVMVFQINKTYLKGPTIRHLSQLIITYACI